ncbi:GNAT family N-acetyltransferase, partial [Enterococcus faecalis]
LNSGEQRTAAHQFYEHIGYVSDKKQKRFIKYLDT